MGHRGIITIDGPAGAGKSTVGRRLAQSLGYLYLDSGALYRAVAWQAQRLGLDSGRTGTPGRHAGGLHAGSDGRFPGFHLVSTAREVTRGTPHPGGDPGVLPGGHQPLVRRWVRERLRQLARNGGVVAEGRDQGTAVFPEAR